MSELSLHTPEGLFEAAVGIIEVHESLVEIHQDAYEITEATTTSRPHDDLLRDANLEPKLLEVSHEVN